MPLSTVSSFKYLGRVLLVVDDDGAAVISNLRKARKRWGHMSQILGWEGGNVQVSGLFYKAAVKNILLL